MKGSILERMAVTGQLAEPVQPLFRIGDLSKLWLTVQAFGRFASKVALIGKEVNSQSRTISVRVEVANRTEAPQRAFERALGG